MKTDTYKTLKAVQELNRMETLEIALCKSYGGFTLSKSAYVELGLEWDGYGSEYTYSGRANPELIKVIKKLGKNASYNCEIEIVKVDTEDILSAYIVNYDGFERIEYKENDCHESVLILERI